ncbi:hypothetical protein L227DRAFT_388652 [Lentinus tigrinus ALCF2SS1-6]|uniref:protein S-acyltransferase n=1 Tax=Lentinus tigrinus ALCF2SS1-6 TaxID=1328759 RepID=A0A5C2SIJ0_9APHY|nr:hypothetical protein L227DRAFT_388652 [Lentinus tigrinus ALCF2SS1-6]
MDDFVSSKGEPSASAVTTTSATGSSMTFPQALQTMQEPDVNIFVAAQRGDVETIRSLIESGKASATDRDEQNITPLHWAAINAQVAACRYLLEQGAEVDALGGDLVATPMQWAARSRCARLARTHFAHVGRLPGRRALCRTLAQAWRKSEHERRYWPHTASLGGCPRQPDMHPEARRSRCGRACEGWGGQDCARYGCRVEEPGGMEACTGGGWVHGGRCAKAEAPQREKHEDCHLLHADPLPIFDVYDPHDSPMVHWNNPRNGAILRHAPHCNTSSA